ncbi:MAG TPA: GNAT family protein [Blastocatellia bacterium]|nr:GNAT family protein [Blastocatellia bacterium]
MFSYKLDEETEIRLLVDADAARMFALTDRNREYLREWLPWVDSTRSVEDTRNFIRGALGQFAANEGFSAGLWYAGELAGAIGFHRIDWPNRRAEIGYWVSREFQGKGIVTRAARAMVDYSFGELELNRVEIHCAEGNSKSRAVAERLGFREEGVLRRAALLYDRYLDMVIYGMLKEDWKAT